MNKLKYLHEVMTLNAHVSADGGAGGQAAAERGPRQRQRAVGEGEQHRRCPTRGYGHINHPELQYFNTSDNTDPGTVHVQTTEVCSSSL